MENKSSDYNEKRIKLPQLNPQSKNNFKKFNDLLPNKNYSEDLEDSFAESQKTRLNSNILNTIEEETQNINKPKDLNFSFSPRKNPNIKSSIVVNFNKNKKKEIQFQNIINKNNKNNNSRKGNNSKHNFSYDIELSNTKPSQLDNIDQQNDDYIYKMSNLENKYLHSKSSQDSKSHSNKRNHNFKLIPINNELPHDENKNINNNAKIFEKSNILNISDQSTLKDKINDNDNTENNLTIHSKNINTATNQSQLTDNNSMISELNEHTPKVYKIKKSKLKPIMKISPEKIIINQNLSKINSN